jgi:dihydroorotate dehydrogenase (NAD+) catalytic subunit
MLLAGASAVQVGTATFADPRAPANVQRELIGWLRERRITRIADLAALT